MATTAKQYNQSAAKKLMTYSDLAQTKSITIESPTVLQQITLMHAPPQATGPIMTIESVNGVIVGADDPVVRFEIRTGTDRSVTGKLIGVQANNITSTTTGDEFDFADSGLADWAWLKITDVQGTVDSVTINITFRGGVGDTVAVPPPPPPPPPAYATITWTTFTQDVGDRIIYVSSTGNDSNDGLTTGTPKQTLAAGYALLRNGYADWMLLKKGDTFTDNSLVLRRGGRSESQPMLIGAYGTGDRPIISPTNHTETSIFITGQTPQGFRCSNMAFVELDFYGGHYNGSNHLDGITYQWAADNVLIEGCQFRRLKSGIVAQIAPQEVGVTHSTNFKVRGNVFYEQYCTVDGSTGVSTAQGIFGGNEGNRTNIDGLLMEFNIFDHNGYLEPGDNPAAVLTWVRHAGYISNRLLNVTLRRNIIMRGDGVMMRSGGSVEDNFYFRVYGPLLYGQGIDPEPAGVTGEVFNNVTLDGCDILDASNNTNVPGPIAMDTGNLAAADIHDNIWANQTTGTGPQGFLVSSPYAHGYGVHRTVSNTLFRNNIFYGWGGVSIAISLATGDTQPTLSIVDNAIDNAVDNALLITENSLTSNAGITSSGNHFYSQHVTSPTTQWFTAAGSTVTLANWMLAMTPDDLTSVNGRITYADPTRSVVTYQTSLGATATEAAFFAACRAQSKDTWDDDYTAPALNVYFREGFTEA